MDKYIYAPPPPPPPGSGDSGSKRGGGGGGRSRRGGGSSNISTKRPHPYARPDQNHQDDGAVDEDSVATPTINVDTTDIAKWIEERRKNWPSSRRVAEKEQEKERLRQLRESNEQKMQQNAQNAQNASNHATGSKNSQGPLCKYFLKGKCKNGNKCRYSHQRSERKADLASKYQRYGAPAKTSLFTKLLQNDMDKENAHVLDFIAYLHTNGHI